MEQAKPFSDYLLLEPEEETHSASGLILPDAARAKIKKGKVVDMGPGTNEYQMEAKVGETVLFNEHRGVKIQFNQKDMVVIRERDCFLRIKKTDA